MSAASLALPKEAALNHGSSLPRDALSFDEVGGLVGALAGFTAAFGAFAGAFVFDADDGQPQQLDDGVVAGEVAAGLGDFAEQVVHGLDRYLGLSRQPGCDLRRPVVGSVADGTLGRGAPMRNGLSLLVEE